MVKMKIGFIVATLTLLLIILLIKMEANNVYVRHMYDEHVLRHTDGTHACSSTLIQQRNNLSRELNVKQKKIGQMECEGNDLKLLKPYLAYVFWYGVFQKQKISHAISESGGWCKLTSTENGGNHKTDKQLAMALATFLTGKTVASFGDGPGRYKQLILDTHLVKFYDAYDGAPYCEQTSEGRVTYLDLTLPQYGLPVYDWVISLEVAEHIPTQYENIYIDNIVRHAKEGIILSWAVPGQGGFHHVNSKPIDYVIELLNGLGFEHDPKESEKMRLKASLAWMKRNVSVYRRKHISTFNMWAGSYA